MPYSFEYSQRAAKALRKLPKDVAAQIVGRIDELEADPRPVGSETLTGSGGLRRVRSGDYRIIYEVRDDVLVVLVVTVGHRRDVYKRLG